MTVRHLRNVSRDPGDYFVMISVNDRDLKFATEVQTSQDHTPDLVWDESFDLAITRLSTVLIEVYNLREVRSGDNPPRWDAIVLPFGDSFDDLLNSNTGTILASAHLRLPNGQIDNNMMLDFSLALNPTAETQRSTNSLQAASPKCTTRITSCIIVRLPPLVSFLSIEYRLQTEKRVIPSLLILDKHSHLPMPSGLGS
jgi:hypothetical protein